MCPADRVQVTLLLSLLYAKAQSGALKARVIDGVPGFMPAAGRLPDDKIEKIKCWLNAGAPNN